MDQSHTRFTYCTAPYRYPAYVTSVAAAATLYRVAQVPYTRTKVFPADLGPNGILVHSHNPRCVTNAANHLCSGLARIW